MLGAQTFFNDKMEKGEWTKRDVGWFSVDIEAHPDLKANDGPNQIIMSSLGPRRMINFHKIDEDKAENEKVIALLMKELSGDWVEEIACEDIQKKERYNYDEVVYLGAAKDIFESGGKATNLNEVSMIDMYYSNDQMIGYFYNTDPECRKTLGYEEDKDYIVFFNG